MATPIVSNVTLGEQVRVKNLDENVLKLQWNSRPYVLAGAGTTTVFQGKEYSDEAFIPFDLAKQAFGDPRSTDIVTAVKDQFSEETQFISDRPAEVRRLQQLWQNTVPKFREYIPGDNSYLDEGISDRAPKVEVYTLAGDRIYTVLDDPLGDRVIIAKPTRSDVDFMSEQLREQSARMVVQDKMIRAMAEKLGINPNDLGPDLPIPAGEPRADARVIGAIRENPAMVYNQRTRKVTRRLVPDSDPTTLESLPEDD